MRDIQNQRGLSGIDIDKVGVCDVSYPIEVLDKKEEKQGTTAQINMYVDLPHHFKGTHMSRFIEVLNQYRGEITVRNMGEILREIARNLEAKSAHMELAFKYFIEKKAPVSKLPSLMGYDCRFIGSYKEGDSDDFILEVKVPVMNLCPCSKEISQTAAHNQRSEVTVQLRFNDFVWIEDIIALVEKSASCDVYALLKRPDEKYVAERAYENPRFVEDIVRIIANEMMSNEKVTWFFVKSINFESIHDHNAYASIERDKRK
ncbi:MAG: GTP cyclohydrolase FolE2 [Candidatus Hodarchaeota archaeon]